jgi:hypothetical protein
MAQDIPSSGEADEMPMPARFWWLKRLAAGLVAFLIASGALKMRADRVSQRKLDAQIAALRAMGEPMTIADFIEPAVADEDNAAAYLTRAAKAMKLGEEDEKAFENLIGTPPPLAAADMQLMDRLMPQFHEALDLVRQARGKSRVNWHLQFQSPAIGILLPHLNEQRELVHVLVLAAAWAHQRGDDAAAVEYVRDMLVIGRAVDRQPFLVSHLVACSCNAAAIKATIQMAPQMKAVAPGQMRALLDELLDERATREGFVHAMQGERLFQVDTMQCLADGRLGEHSFGRPLLSPFGRFVARPILWKEARDMLPFGNAMVEAARQPDLPTASAKMPPRPNPASRWKQPFASMLIPALGAVANRHYAALSGRRQAAIAVAERLYELEHGKKPARIEDLVPQYLPEVLVDPSSMQGTKLGLTAATQPAK